VPYSGLLVNFIEHIMETKSSQIEHQENFMEDVKKDPVSTPTYTKEEEGRAVRKLDWVLIPLLGVLYMLSYVDRGNIGNAYSKSSWP
jgi:hypothetical protein